MCNEKDLIEFIGECIQVGMSSRTIESLKWIFSLYTPVPKTNKYDKLTISEYILYYKINRLETLGIITTDIKNELIALYDKYLEIGKKIGEEVYKEMTVDGYKSNDLQELHLIDNMLKEKLIKYNLNDDNFDLQQMIDNQIIAEYTNKATNKIKKLEL